MDSCEPCVPEGSITSSPCPVQVKDTNELTCLSSMLLIPVPASIDDALTAQPDSKSVLGNVILRGQLVVLQAT